GSASAAGASAASWATRSSSQGASSAAACADTCGELCAGSTVLTSGFVSALSTPGSAAAGSRNQGPASTWASSGCEILPHCATASRYSSRVGAEDSASGVASELAAGVVSRAAAGCGTSGTVTGAASALGEEISARNSLTVSSLTGVSSVGEASAARSTSA